MTSYEDPYLIISAIAVGVGASMLWYELSRQSPGSSLAPGMATVIALTRFWLILPVILASILTEMLIRKLSGKMIIFGKRRYALFALISILILLTLEHVLQGPAPADAVIVIAYLLPSFISVDFPRQGISRTLNSFALVTAGTVGIMMGLAPFL